jgi:hypothetical protein
MVPESAMPDQPLSLPKSTIPGKHEFKESHAPPKRDDLLARRISDLNLRLEESRIARLARRLHDELAQAGFCFRPPVYLSDEWGCPDRVPIIGVPFYLAHPDLTRLEDEFMEGVEAESDDQIMRYLRHEAGHALNYAYRLYDTPQWNSLFGPFLRPYLDDYKPNPFSRSFVRHLPGWYAQKHPDEDFAETFAVWLDAGSNWRKVYANWRCLPKLQYVDDLKGQIGNQPPPVTAENYDTQEEYLNSTVGEFYSRAVPRQIEVPPLFDTALEDIFPRHTSSLHDGQSAAAFLKKHRREIVGAVFYWTGLNNDIVRALVGHFEQRCAAIDLQVPTDSAAKALIETVTLVTTLSMNRLHTGDFVHK